MIGEARTGGVINYIAAKDSTLWMSLMISEGACDSITGLFIDGEEQVIRRTTDGVISIVSGE